MSVYDPSVFNQDLLSARLGYFSSHCDFVVAYSGGLDSHVLLYALASLRDLNASIKMRAVHVNHGLHVDADDWAQHCRDVCDALSVPLLIESVSIDEDADQSIEHLARQARYAVLEKALKTGEVLLTAHHQEDQAETVLLQLLRGAGPQGLSAMRASRSFAESLLMRPLLPFSRQALLEYAQRECLDWIEDESNNDQRFDRNFLRHDIFPRLKTRWPAATRVLSRAAGHCSEMVELAQDLAQLDLEAIRHDHCVSLDKLLLLSESRQHNVVRYWIQNLGFQLPSAVKLRQIFETVIVAAPDRSPVVAWEGVEIRRYRHRLYALDPDAIKPVPPDTVIPWRNLSEALQLPLGLGALLPSMLPEELPKEAQAITIRFRQVDQGAERLKLPGQKHHHSLKNLFQEQGIPPWQRSRVPLIYQGEALVGVVLSID